MPRIDRPQARISSQESTVVSGAQPGRSAIANLCVTRHVRFGQPQAMGTWTITTASVPDTLDHPEAWAAHGAAAVDVAANLEAWGRTDLADSAQVLLSRLRNQTYTAKSLLVATAPDGVGRAEQVVGQAHVELPRDGNDHAAYVHLLVHPEHRRRGVGTALADEAERRAAEAGRSTLISFSDHMSEPPQGDRDAIVAPTGSGRIWATDPGAIFASSRGFGLTQASRYSVLDLPVDEANVQVLHDNAMAQAGADYALVTWRDTAPDDMVDPIAALATAMSTDAPTGETDLRHEVWTAQRYRDWEKAIADSGRGYLTVAARHLPSGEVVAYSQTAYVRDRPEGIWQDDTIVRRDHRGHRLGMLVKSEMLRYLATQRPGARRIHTWNAEENSHMLAINVALGFRPVGVSAVWQRLDS